MSHQLCLFVVDRWQRGKLHESASTHFTCIVWICEIFLLHLNKNPLRNCPLWYPFQFSRVCICMSVLEWTSTLHYFHDYFMKTSSVQEIVWILTLCAWMIPKKKCGLFPLEWLTQVSHASKMSASFILLVYQMHYHKIDFFSSISTELPCFFCTHMVEFFFFLRTIWSSLEPSTPWFDGSKRKDQKCLRPTEYTICPSLQLHNQLAVDYAIGRDNFPFSPWGNSHNNSWEAL